MDFDPLSDNEEDVTFMPERKKKDKEGIYTFITDMKQTTLKPYIHILSILTSYCFH